MKKVLMTLTAAALLLSLCGCGENKKESGDKASERSVTTVSEVSAIEGSEADASKAEGSQEAAAGSLSAALEKVKAEVTMPTDTADYTQKRLKRVFGIEADQVEEFAGMYCIDGVSQEMLLYIRAKTDADVKDIQDKLQEDWQATYNVIKNYTPEQAAVIEQATVDTNGRVVSLVISSQADKIKSIFNEYL